MKLLKMTAIVLLLCTISITASPMPTLPERDIYGIVTEVIYNPEITYQGYATSAYYYVKMKDVLIELNDENATNSELVVLGELDSTVISISPTEEVEALQVGDTIAIIGYTQSGDEFSQSYRYEELKVSLGPTAIATNLNGIRSTQIFVINSELRFANSAPYSINILSAKGQLLKEISGRERTVSLNSLDLANGIYLMRVLQGADVFTGQFILK